MRYQVVSLTGWAGHSRRGGKGDLSQAPTEWYIHDVPWNHRIAGGPYLSEAKAERICAEFNALDELAQEMRG